MTDHQGVYFWRGDEWSWPPFLSFANRHSQGGIARRIGKRVLEDVEGAQGRLINLSWRSRGWMLEPVVDGKCQCHCQWPQHSVFLLLAASRAMFP